ncbi:MAG: hypothetical protein ACRDPR_05245 [Nocardioidaceae bacterium]
MMVQPTCLAIEVDAGAGAGAGELDQLTMQLWRELSELDLDSVERVRQGAAPAGARAADVLALGTLLVAMAKPLAALPAVVGVIRTWLAGRGERSVKLEIDGDVLEVTGLTSDDQRRLISSWIDRHTTPPGTG